MDSAAEDDEVVFATPALWFIACENRWDIRAVLAQWQSIGVVASRTTQIATVTPNPCGSTQL